MGKYAINLKEELNDLKFEHNFYQKIYCSSSDNKKYRKIVKENGTLPENIFEDKDAYEGNFYTIYKTELTNDEKQEYLQLKKLSYIRTIKNCCIFFVILTIISIIISFFLFGNLLSAFKY